MSPIVYALLLLAAFGLALYAMWRDVCRQCEKAQREVELDALWGDDEDDAEVAA